MPMDGSWCLVSIVSAVIPWHPGVDVPVSVVERAGAPEPLVWKPPRIVSELEVEDGDVSIPAEVEDVHGHVHVDGVLREHL